jgi:hypothetical protein
MMNGTQHSRSLPGRAPLHAGARGLSAVQFVESPKRVQFVITGRFAASIIC